MQQLCYNAVMTSEPQNEPVLKRLRADVAEVYGDRLERVVLYGSRKGRLPPGFRL
jgi:hypothetical protein